MNRYITIALLITFLDATGMGLIMPVLPTLLEEFSVKDSIATHYGLILALYALMQVIFAPILGQLSDKYGRKPILILSLIGVVCDYTLLSFSSALWMLYLGRMVAGISAATGAIAASMIADHTNAAERTKWFGRLGAAFGAGLIAGPAIGGFIGQYSAHLPFAVAAILNALALIMVILRFPKTPSQKAEQDLLEIPQSDISNTPFRQIIKPVLLLLTLFFTVQLIGQVPATIWVLFTEYRFDWNTFNIGLSLAGLGLMHIIFQAFIAGYMATRWKNETIFVLGFILDASAFLLLAFISNVWLLLPALVLLAGGGMALPALQGLISVKTAKEHQGKLQGIIVSLTNITGIIGPPLFAIIYAKTVTLWDGTLWIIGASLYSLLLMLYFLYQKINRKEKYTLMNNIHRNVNLDK